MKKLENIVLIAFIFTVAFIVYMTPSRIDKNVGGQSQTIGRWSSLEETGLSTASSTLLTTNSQRVAATSSSREYMEISNLSGVAIYCNADRDKPAVAYKGVTIFASSTKVFGQDFAYTGSVQCVVPSGTASTTVYSKQ